MSNYNNFLTTGFGGRCRGFWSIRQVYGRAVRPVLLKLPKLTGAVVGLVAPRPKLRSGAKDFGMTTSSSTSQSGKCGTSGGLARLKHCATAQGESIGRGNYSVPRQDKSSVCGSHTLTPEKPGLLVSSEPVFLPRARWSCIAPPKLENVCAEATRLKSARVESGWTTTEGVLLSEVCCDPASCSSSVPIVAASVLHDVGPVGLTRSLASPVDLPSITGAATLHSIFQVLSGEGHLCRRGAGVPAVVSRARASYITPFARFTPAHGRVARRILLRAILQVAPCRSLALSKSQCVLLRSGF